jgi:hypothetical protein
MPKDMYLEEIDSSLPIVPRLPLALEFTLKPRFLQLDHSSFFTTLHQACTQHSKTFPPSRATLSILSITLSACPDLPSA